MKMKLTVPHMDRSFERGTIRRWFKEPGDAIGVGDHICEVLSETQVVLEVPRNAKVLTRLSKRSKVSTTSSERKRPVAWRIVAREAGTLESVEVGGDEVEVGTVLAAVSIPGGEDTTDDLASLPEFRAFGERAPEEGDEDR